jgi:hypothetical protein
MNRIAAQRLSSTMRSSQRGQDIRLQSWVPLLRVTDLWWLGRIENRE